MYENLTMPSYRIYEARPPSSLLKGGEPLVEPIQRARPFKQMKVGKMFVLMDEGALNGAG